MGSSFHAPGFVACSPPLTTAGLILSINCGHVCRLRKEYGKKRTVNFPIQKGRFLMKRIFSFSLVQMVIEIAGCLLAFLLLQLLLPLFLLLPNLLLADVFAKVVLALLIGGWYLLAARFLERRSFAEIGFPGRHQARDLASGFLLGAGLMAGIIGIMALAGWYHVTRIEPVNTLFVPLLATFVLFFAVAVAEEIIFRGILFRLVEQALGSWIAVLLSALFFGLSHLMTPHATIIGALAIAATGGVASASIYLLTRNLWSVFGLHWAWNFFEGAIFGTQVSGGDTPVWLHSVTTGPALWTGGSFGPEAGLVTIIVGGSVSLFLLIVAWRRHCLRTPGWQRRSPGSLRLATQEAVQES
jgi:membrane protease YdiL (CAAX protease family)